MSEKRDVATIRQVRRIAVSSITPNPHQPRKQFTRAGIRELARTIEEHGLLQPILVRQLKGRYELIAGERRLRAVRSLKWKTIPALVIPESAIDAHQSAEMALVENIMRSDLNPLEEGLAFRYLLDHGQSYRVLAKRIGKDKGYIQNRVRLLGMPDDLKELVRCKPAMLIHAYELNKVQDGKLRLYHVTKLMNEGGSKYSLSQLRHELKYARTKQRDNCDHLYALWDYDFLRDPTDGDELYQGNSTPSVVERCLKCIYRDTPASELKKKTLWIPFAGSGTGINTASKMGIGKIIASDINPVSASIKKINALDSELPSSSIDCIFAHPPYWSTVEYTKIYSETPDKRDVSLCQTLEEFLRAMDAFFKEADRVLKKGGYLFVMIGDIRKGNKLIPLTAHLTLLGERHLTLIQRAIKIRKRSSRLMPILISNAKKRGHLVDILDTVLFFRKG